MSKSSRKLNLEVTFPEAPLIGSGVLSAGTSALSHNKSQNTPPAPIITGMSPQTNNDV